MATLTIKGKSGAEYTFYVHKLPVKFKQSGGVYLFTKLLDDKKTHRYIYLGITEDLSERFDNHHKAECIKNEGATHLCAFTENNKSKREKIEEDLLASISTRCNEQKK